jgi:hypothetical protein
MVSHKVIATTRHDNGTISYDAICWASGKKKLVKGEMKPTADEAIADLLQKVGAI